MSSGKKRKKKINKRLKKSRKEESVEQLRVSTNQTYPFGLGLGAELEQYQVTLRSRHLRYIFFIDQNSEYDYVLDLIYRNQRIWGGRYNPIIPVVNGVISDDYKSMAKYYDPDYVFYSKEVDPNKLKQLRLFNPIGYFNLDKTPPEADILGVDAFYFISQFDRNAKVLQSTNLWESKSVLLSFYKLNFGIEGSGIFSDSEISRQASKLTVKKEDLEALNKIIHQELPINQAYLSRRNVNTKILRSFGHARYNECELVISKDKTSSKDLIYFWNRLLYEGFNTVHITSEELKLLCTDKFFGGVLRDLSRESIVYVVSFSLSEEEVKSLISEYLQPIAFERSFERKNVDAFPFTVADGNGLFERDYGEVPTTQTFVGKQGIISIPKLSFTNKVSYYGQMWALDLQIKRLGSSLQDEILFPLTFNSNWMVRTVKSRINRNRRPSVLIHNQQTESDYLEILIPNGHALASQLISHPLIDGNAERTKYVSIGFHDSSNKLKALIKSFDSNFYDIDDFFTDHFWVSMIEDLCVSEKAVGDAIDFVAIKAKAIEALSKKGIVLGPKGTTYRNEENLELGLKSTLQGLCERKVFFKGFNLKCPFCASQAWYHINEAKDIVSCKGCLREFPLPTEPKFFYRLNDLIRNNVYSTKTTRDGNLAVVRTLALLSKRAMRNFLYLPQLNLYDNFHVRKPVTDIDIFCIVDGDLVIGEAKHSSELFTADSNKQLLSLVEIAKAIRPDKVILSCYDDSKGKLSKAKQGLVHYFHGWEFMPEIETILLSPPDDFSIGNHSYFYY